MPADWVFRPGNTSTNTTVKFITETGAVLESYQAALQLLEASPAHDVEDIMKIRILMEETAVKRRKGMEEWQEVE